MSETEKSEEKSGEEGSPLATARMGPTGFRVEIDSLGHLVVADEPEDVGGNDEGPNPFALLYASLASCVLITLRMYAKRKEWPLMGASLRLFPERREGAPVESIALELELEGEDLTDEQRDRLLDIAGKCPVHRTLEREVHVETRLA